MVSYKDKRTGMTRSFDVLILIVMDNGLLLRRGGGEWIL